MCACTMRPARRFLATPTSGKKTTGIRSGMGAVTGRSRPSTPPGSATASILLPSRCSRWGTTGTAVRSTRACLGTMPTSRFGATAGPGRDRVGEESLGLLPPDDVTGGREQVVVEGVVQSIGSSVRLERAQVVGEQPAGFQREYAESVVQRSFLPQAALVRDRQPGDGAEQCTVHGLLLCQLVGGQWAEQQNHTGILVANQL